MARGKPLTGFLLALSHSPKLLEAFNDPERRGQLLEEWGLLEEHVALLTGEPTLAQVQDAVKLEHGGEGEGDGGETSVGVAWWIWFFGDPT
jgi:hypothetical protein